MSKKADALMKNFGGTIASTVGKRPTPTADGAGGDAAGTLPSAPDKYAGATRSRGFAEMPIEVIACEAQPRTEFDPEELQLLADSIKRFGQLAPIRVRHDAATGRWIVLVGERRLRACKLAGLSTIRVELVEKELTEADILAEQIVENAVRADLQPVEQAHAFRRLMDLKDWNAQTLASTLGIDQTRVYRALALLKLPEDVAREVDSGAIKATAGYELSKLDDQEEQRALARRIVEENLDHGTTVAEVRRRRKVQGSPPRSRGAAQPPPARNADGGLTQVFQCPNGVRVTIEIPDGRNPAAVIADLLSVIEELELRLARSHQHDAA